MAKVKATFVRLCKAEVEALTREERQDYMARLFAEARRQISANRLLIERKKRNRRPFR